MSGLIRLGQAYEFPPRDGSRVYITKSTREGASEEGVSAVYKQKYQECACK